MKEIFSALFALLAGGVFAQDAPLKVLMVGNSFSLSCKTYLRQVAASAKCGLDLEIAYIGGCSLERHVREYETSQSDPAHRPYRTIDNRPSSLQELLGKKKWDIISIQQASHLSWRADSYHPWSEKLIGIILKTNPQAEIVIQETWSYNGGDRRFAALNPNWSVDQTTMFEELDKNYRKLAKDNNFRIVPVGVAVQLTREEKPLQLPTCDEKFIRSFTYPDPLPETTDVVGRCGWGKKQNLGVDTIHLNLYGQYLQACVWCSFLFGKPVSDITFYPPELDRERVEKLRAFAQKALDLEKNR